jgi:pentatricopeptide repeat protein
VQHSRETCVLEDHRMTIAIRSPARKTIFLATCLTLSTLYIGFVARGFAADYFSKKLDLASLQTAAALEPGNAHYQYRLGNYFLESQQAPGIALPFFKSATALNPYDSRYWLQLSRTYHRLDIRDRQKDALQHATAVDPSNPDVAWDAANFYWSMGETDKALREFRVVVENDPYLPAAALEACWRIKPNVKALLRDAMPRNPDTYSTFLEFLISKNEPDAAATVWNEMVKLHHPVDKRYVFEYLRYLINGRQIERARQVWTQSAIPCDLSEYQPSPENRVVNGDFSLPVLNAGFDWTYEKSSDVSLALDPTVSHVGHRSLSIIFDSRGIEDAGIRQLIPVEPNTNYEFSANFKTQALEGAGGPRFVLEDQFSGKNFFASDELKEADVWKEVKGSFSTGVDTDLLVLRVQRVPTGNAIRGKLWIADIRLTPSSAVQQQTIAGGQ